MNSRYNVFRKPKLTGKFLPINILIILALIGIIGCSQNPLQPDLLADGPVLSQASKFVEQDKTQKCYESSGLITVADGGEIQLGWGGPKNRIQFEPGAINEDVVIDITTCTAKSTSHDIVTVFEFDFGPDGLFFSPSAKIIVNAASLNALRAPKHKGVVKLYYHDPETGEWLLQQEAKIFKGKVTFEISHFSKFGISH